MTPEDLVQELEQTDDDTLVEVAAEALAEGDADAEAVRRLLVHRSATVRRAATLALGHRRDLEAREELERRLKDASGPVRAAACRALALLGDLLSLPRLLPLADDRLGSVRAAAAEALGGFTSPQAVSALDALLRQERGPGPRRAAIAALGRLGAAAELREAALTALAQHVGREHEVDLADVAAEHLLALTRGLTYAQLLGPFRAVPLSGRTALADALSARALDPPLPRLVQELHDRPPDPDVLARFGSDLTERARHGALGRAYGRSRELKAIRDRLSRPGSRSLVLVGPSGVGKTAIVHELARRLAHDPVLVPTVVHESTTGEVLSGTRFLGEWQTRLKELQAALQAPHKAVWYVPDVNRLVDAGTTVHSDESFATMLAPALERGELVILGESTPEAFRRGLDRFPGLSRLFWKLHVEEPQAAATLAILRELARELAERGEQGRSLAIPDATIERAFELSEDYLSSTARPGRTVFLLREAVSAAVQERERADEERRPAEPGPVPVSPQQVLTTLSALSGVPVRLLDDAVPLDLGEVRRFFTERVLGQDEAVEAMVDLIGLIKAGLTDPSRPLGVFFFVGPTGVGKTEMAKATAELIFGSRDRLVRIDLGEFKEPDAHRRLVGDPQALEPASRSGLLTAPVRERPFSVVLLDEVEKAHRNVFDLLLPLMAEGRLVDEQGRVTDFRRAIIIMTSNLGSDLREDTGLGFASGPDDGSSKVLRVMEEVFRPEFLNRIGRTILFAPLSVEVMRRLTRRELRRVLERRGIVRRNVITEVDDAVIGLLLREGFSARYGARPLKRRVEELILTPLSRALLTLRPDEGQAIVRLRVDGDRVTTEVIREQREEAEDDVASASRSAARIKDPRRGRLVALDDIEARVSGLVDRVGAMDALLAEQGLRERKRSLMEASTAPDFWEDREQAAGTLSEIAHLERTLELPGRLERRLRRLEGLIERAARRPGETRALHDLLARTDEVAQEVELGDYTLRCSSPEERGDAYLLLRRVGDAEFPEDIVAAAARMYLGYARRKGFVRRTVFEAVSNRTHTLREVGLYVGGACAHGLFKGEAGLHEWVHKDDPDGRRPRKRVAFVRVSVLPPAEPLRPAEVTRERRNIREEAGVVLRKHRLHLVLTHQDSLVAVDGNTPGNDEDEEEALAFLAARVAASRRGGRDPGVVRRYVTSPPALARDFAADLKAPLDRVLEGQLDDFVLPRVLG